VGPKFLRITDIQNGKVDWNTVPYCKCDNHDKYRLRPGDILFARTGATTGKSFLIRDCPHSVFASYLIRVQLSKEVYPAYVYQFLQTPSYWSHIAQFTTGSTQGGFNASKLAEIRVPLPPLPIQKQIAAILEKADAAREKRRQASQLTEQFLQSAFLEMFGDPVTNPKGWDVRTLEEVCAEIVDCPHSTPIHSDSITEYPCIRTTELRNGNIDWSAMKYVTEETYRERTRRLVPKEGDIIYGREGSFGEAVRAPGNVKICLGQRTMLFRADQDICISEYLWSAIRSESVYRQALRITTGSTVGHLNVKDVKQFKVLIPSITEQQKFATLVEKVESLRAKQKESGKELESLFNSLMQRAFSGELVQ